MDRIDWNGSKRSNDIQDASIYLLNVTFNDSGTYRCFFNRILTYDNYEYNDIINKVVHLTVVAKGTMPSALTVSCEGSDLVSVLPACSHQRYSFHRVRGHDVRVHHRAAALAPHRDDLLLQKDLCSWGGSVTRGSVRSPRLSPNDSWSHAAKPDGWIEVNHLPLHIGTVPLDLTCLPRTESGCSQITPQDHITATDGSSGPKGLPLPTKTLISTVSRPSQRFTAQTLQI
ncbi:hypothetical protein XENOCAPTIV_003552 [Xenoophorus captivus]|uniref:Uncharacterized protein n=1 Tax=Xenoophorus captivus TaxID=1517983 RepID=A0ABV0Q7T4_9TELE